MGKLSPWKRRVSWGLGVSAISIGAACGLDSGSILATSGTDGDASDVDGANLGDGGGPTDAANADESNESFDAGTLPDGAVARHVFAATNSAIYSFDIDTHVLTRVLGFAFCGLDGGYDTFDLAQASTRQVFVIPWKTSGQFWFYAVETDGGCVDVHGGPGTNPGATNMWGGFQNTGGTDTLFSLVQGQTTLYSYNTLGQYIASASALPSGGAKSDIACSSTLCYTSLAHNKCPTDPGGGNDCLYSFKNDGSMGTQGASFGTDKVVGIAYYGGTLFGFCNDGSIFQVSATGTTPGSKIDDVSYGDGGSPSGLAWVGAASLPN